MAGSLFCRETEELLLRDLMLSGGFTRSRRKIPRYFWSGFYKRIRKASDTQKFNSFRKVL